MTKVRPLPAQRPWQVVIFLENLSDQEEQEEARPPKESEMEPSVFLPGASEFVSSKERKPGQRPSPHVYAIKGRLPAQI